MISDEPNTRRKFLDVAGKAAVLAPATTLLLSASTKMALPYGGGNPGNGPKGNNGFGNGGGDGSPNGKEDSNR